MEVKKKDVLALCKFYKQEKENPFHCDYKSSGWEIEYVRMHVWDAERTSVENCSSWIDIYKSQHPEIPASAEDIYNMAVIDKLDKANNFSSFDTFDIFNKM